MPLDAVLRIVLTAPLKTSVGLDDRLQRLIGGLLPALAKSRRACEDVRVESRDGANEIRVHDPSPVQDRNLVHEVVDPRTLLRPGWSDPLRHAAPPSPPTVPADWLNG